MNVDCKTERVLISGVSILSGDNHSFDIKDMSFRNESVS